MLQFLSTIAPLICCLAAAVVADGTFRSRPDLSPPHLNVTIECSGRCESGFIFIAPYVGYADLSDHGPLQSGAYILTDSGDLVWSGFTYFSVWAANLQAARWKGQDVLFAFEGAHNGLHGHGHGHHTILDQHYQTIRELRAGNHFLSDKHEFIILDEKSALFQIYHPMQIDLTPYGGNIDQSWIVDARFQEMDIESGAVLFEWRSLDHICPDESALPLPLGQAGFANNSSMAWDYFHINSITKGDDGHYLLSARHASTIYKINGTDGTVIWRLGGKRSDFVLGPNVTFGFQHHARYVKDGTGSLEVISLFDNSVYGSEAGGGGDKEVHLYPFSRGKYIRLNYESKTATLEHVLHPPNNSILPFSQGSLQTLPNTNVLIGWGSEGQITEYSPDGEPVFHAFLDCGFLQDKVQNYRTFRYNWTGFSSETIAVFAEKVDHPPATNIYVSWNGDTETAVWRFVWFEEAATGLIKKMKDIKRIGFETKLRLSGPPAAIGAIHVEAINSDGQVLMVSEDVQAVPAYWRNAASSEVMQSNESPEVTMNIDEL
ncbi:hypothetical protein MMC22_008311 [Lobaria immixta]|nr:hypothetical protein [Lobaria immixta]